MQRTAIKGQAKDASIANASCQDTSVSEAVHSAVLHDPFTHSASILLILKRQIRCAVTDHV